ncbi:ParA family protein [Moorellaceae bacterium AZ2]
MVRRILAVANQKGGVGKTTAAINLAAVFASRIPTLLVDMDPQGNATEGVGIKEGDVKVTVAEVLEGECKIRDAIVKTEFGQLAVLPADIGLAGIEGKDVDARTLLQKLNELGEEYYMVVIDCPPSLGRLTISALAAADRVLVPVKPGRFSLKGLQQLFGLVESIRLRGINPTVRVLGIFYNEVQANTNLFRAIDAVLRKGYGHFLLDTVVPSNVKIGESQIVGEPVGSYDRSSRGYEAYLNLAREVLEKWDRVARIS